jgi:DNA polymerase type B, organellar and viral
MDIETITTNGIMSPVCISVYDGINVSSFYLSNFENSDKMLIAAIESIMKPCYKNNVVYLHNFSYFDAVFLIKILSSFNAKISPIIRDNCIIDFKFKFQYSNNKFITLYFRDSYLLIPSSLSNLSRVFKVLKKDIFPYKFLKLENIHYTGNVPLFEEFDNISLEDYNNYVNNYKPHTDKE